MRLKNILLALILPFAAAGNIFAQQDVILLDSLPVVHYSDGVRLAVEERYDEALQKFLKALKTDPDHDPSLFEAANVLATLGRATEALEYSSRAVELDPSNRWYKGQKGRLLLSRQMYDEAEALYEGMIADRGVFDPENHRMLAILYHRKGRTDDALATLDSVTIRTGKHPAVVDLKRSILTDAGRMDEAIAETEEYIAVTPYDEENRLMLARMYLFQGRDSLGTAAVKEVLDINPDNAEALVALAEIYQKNGQTALYFATLKQLFMLDGIPLAEKVDRFERLTRNQTFYRRHFMEIGDLALVLVTRYPGREEVVDLYANHLLRIGDPEGALMMLKTRLRGNDPSLATFMKVMEIETWLKRADSVTFYADRALAVYPDEHSVYMLRASAEQYMGRMKDARRTLDRALRTAATDSLRSEIHGAIGTLWHEEGNNRKTFDAYDKALAYDSNNALVLNNYAYFLAVEGRELDRALGMASRAVRLKENDATFLDTYAWVLYKLGNFAEAKKVMQQALPLDDGGGSAELLIHYGDILYALGEEFMASVYWKRARDAGYEPVAEIEERLLRMK